VAVAATVEDQQAAVETIVHAVLKAIATAGDQDKLSPESQRAVEAVALNLVADAAVVIPIHQRLPVLSSSSSLVCEFLDAVVHETP
jgi:hypothetical protein